MRWVLPVILIVTPSLHAGIHYRGETYAELPSQWRGFFIDQRNLRNLAVKESATIAASPGRVRYLEEATRLANIKSPEADDLADLGAIYLRLGEPAKAFEVLRNAQRLYPHHFAIHANLGSACQALGDLPGAVQALREAVRLAPLKWMPAEALHLKLVQGRLAGKDGLDDLFGVRFVNDRGVFESGKWAEGEKKKLPSKALAHAQQLALWLPSDGRLLWQLAELSNGLGDIANAAAMFEGCVVAFGMGQPELRRHRQEVRATADAILKASAADKEQHAQKHGIAFRSKRPLLSKFDQTPLPEISATGVNAVPWDLFGETTLDSKAKPTFPQYLRDLEGKEISLSGFMQPLQGETEAAAFLFIEYPVGCWFCEMPETTGIIYVALPPGTSVNFTRDLIRVTGRLALNQNDPEDFLYAIRNARVGGID